MGHVTVLINGRQYRMACEDGQEEHLTRLAADLDLRIDNLRGSFGEIGDMRLAVMAALTVADELVDTNERLKRVEAELASLQDARIIASDRAQLTQQAVSAALHSAAERIERVTTALSRSPDEIGIG